MKTSKLFQSNIFREILIVFIIVIGVIFFSHTFEESASSEKGIIFDGSTYYRITQKISLHQPIVDEAPFVYRLGTPFLVSLLFPHDLFLGYRTINLVASIICVYLLLFWLRLYINNSVVRMILVGLFASHWLGVLRITLNSPIHVESVSLVFNLLGFIFVYYLQSKPDNILLICIFSAAIFIGVIFRESIIFIPFVYVILRAGEFLRLTPYPKLRIAKEHIFLILPIISGILGVLLTRILVAPANSFSLAGAMIYWSYKKPLPAYIQSYFTTFGPMLAILVPSATIVKEFLLRERFNLYYLVLVCLLAGTIGSDTDRFLFWTMPVWYTMFGLALEYLWPMFRRNWGLLVTIIILQSLAQRSFLPVPDYSPEKILYRIPVLTVICNDGCGLDVASYNGITGSGLDAAMCTPSPCLQNGIPYPLQLLLFIENVLVVGILAWFLLRARSRFLFTQPIKTNFQEVET